MFDKIMHKTINIAAGFIAAVFGGYILAAIICFIIAGIGNILGFNITANELIDTTIGFVVLILSLLSFGFIGYFTSDIIQHSIAKIFKSSSINFSLQSEFYKK